jgi:6-phosphogluconolactonase
MNTDYKIFPTPQHLAEAFAMDLAKRINSTAEKGKYLSVALSGGQTPRLLFTVLAEKYSSSINWNHVHFFWVDERCVPPDDPESNFGMTKQLLLDKINIPQDNIHRMYGEDDPDKEAERYSGEIITHVRNKNMIPLFGIIILGMGEDGHTASIFPGNERLLFSNKICEIAIHPVSQQKRITLTGKVINNAEEIFFLVTGIRKSQIINEIIKKYTNSAMFPASHIKSLNGKTIWLIDEEAAKCL